MDAEYAVAGYKVTVDRRRSVGVQFLVDFTPNEKEKVDDKWEKYTETNDSNAGGGSAGGRDRVCFSGNGVCGG
jgi:hypothetical protein